MGQPHAVSALIAKRREIAGEIQEAEKRVKQLRADLAHVDAVLRMFDSSAEPEALPIKRPYRRNRWFADGELPRVVLDTLRLAEKPLSESDIGSRVMAAKGMDAGDAKASEVVAKSVGRFLRARKDGTVRRVNGDGRGTRWRVAEWT